MGPRQWDLHASPRATRDSWVMRGHIASVISIAVVQVWHHESSTQIWPMEVAARAWWLHEDTTTSAHRRHQPQSDRHEREDRHDDDHTLRKRLRRYELGQPLGHRIDERLVVVGGRKRKRWWWV